MPLIVSSSATAGASMVALPQNLWDFQTAVTRPNTVAPSVVKRLEALGHQVSFTPKDALA